MNNTAQVNPKHQLGFTLIELMLVVLIIGFAATLVMMTVDDSKQKKAVKRAAYKMAALSDIALDKAVLSGQEFGIVFGSDKYHFVHLNEKRWQAVDDDVLTEQTLDNISIAVEVDGFEWLPDQVDFSSSAFYDDREVDRELDEEENPHIPQLLILSSGEMTPFKVTLSLDSEKIYDLRLDEENYVATVTANSLGLLNVMDSNDDDIEQ